MSPPLLFIVLSVSSWCSVSAEIKLYVQQDTIESSTSDDVMLPVIYDANAPPRIIWGQNCDFEDGFVWCNMCNKNLSSYESSHTGFRFQGRLTAFEQNGSIIIKNLQLSDTGQFCVRMSDVDGSNAVYGKITLHIKDHFLSRSTQCPVLQEGPLSGIKATPIPGILLNNVDFIHLPVVLNFSNWTMAELGQCENANSSLIYASLLTDIITNYQERSQDLSYQKTLNSSQQGLDELANYMSIQFALGTSIWNKFDIGHIIKHINCFLTQTGENITNSLISGIRELAEEDHYTIYNMTDLVELMSDTNAKLAHLMPQSGKDTQQSQEKKECICSAYGSFVLNIIKGLLKDVENGQVPDVIRDEELAKLYCPACISNNQNPKQFWECATSCMKLNFNTIRKLGSVTRHPNKATCYLQASCSEPALYISFTLSLPAFNIATSVFDKLATIQSVGLLEGSIFKERINIPSLVIFHPELNSWVAPNTDCCSIIKYKYVCRCDVFDVRIPVCGYDSQMQNESSALSTSCAVKLAKWRVPTAKVTHSTDGLYCVVTNRKQYSYGSLSCNITSPNFCFTPRQLTVIGHTVITNFADQRNSDNAQNQDNNVFPPQFNVHISPLTNKLMKLLEHKHSHLIHISNQKDAQILNEMISDDDNNLIDNSLDQLKLRIQILITVQAFVILIILLMIYCLCNIFKHNGFKLYELFTHPYLKISK